jgi:hypothetical protein
MSTRQLAVLAGTAATAAVIGFAWAGGFEGRQREADQEVVLRTALAETFSTVNGVSIATSASSRFVGLVGTNRLDLKSVQELRVFEVGPDGAGIAIEAPFTSLSDDAPMQTARAGNSWCVAGVSPRGDFAGACRAIGAGADSPWRLLPQPPRRGGASYDIVGAGADLYALVTTVEGTRSMIHLYRLDGRRWRQAGRGLTGRGSIASPSVLDGRPVVTIVQPVRPRVRALMLSATGRWRLLVPGRARGSLSEIGAGPLLGTPQKIGGHLALGLSRPTSEGLQFGVASLRSGNFTTAPVGAAGQAQGAVFATGPRSGWAIWKEAWPDERTRMLRGTIRAARLSGNPASWKGALATAKTLFDGTWISANIAVTRQNGRYYAVHPVFTGRRIAYRMTRLE